MRQWGWTTPIRSRADGTDDVPYSFCEVTRQTLGNSSEEDMAWELERTGAETAKKDVHRRTFATSVPLLSINTVPLYTSPCRQFGIILRDATLQLVIQTNKLLGGRIDWSTVSSPPPL